MVWGESRKEERKEGKRGEGEGMLEEEERKAE